MILRNYIYIIYYTMLDQNKGMGLRYWKKVDGDMRSYGKTKKTNNDD